MIINPENLIENLPNIGGWSTFSLAETAIHHYHPEVKEMTCPEDITYMAQLKCDGKEDTSWHDWIIKYHKEVGYKNELNPENVNEH